MTPDYYVAAFAGWAILVFAVALLLRKAPTPLVFAQTIAPVAFYGLGRISQSRKELVRLFEGLLAGSLLTCLWLGASIWTGQTLSRYNGRLSDQLIGGVTVYQAYDYFPLLLVIALCATVALCVELRNSWLAPAGAVVAGTVIALYSRGALLAAGAAAVVFLLLWRRAFPPRLLVGLIATGVVLFAGSLAGGVTATTRLVDSVTGGGSDGQSNLVRTASLRAAADRVADNPVLGRGYAATERAPGTEVAKTLNTHNQYLDYAVRGGVPLALLLLAVVCAACVRAWNAASLPGGDPLLAAIVAASAGAVVSGLFQSPFIQPLTAIPLWLLLGHLASLSR